MGASDLYDFFVLERPGNKILTEIVFDDLPGFFPEKDSGTSINKNSFMPIYPVFFRKKIVTQVSTKIVL